MSSTMHQPETVKQTHPIRGFFWGLVFGIGLALFLAFTKVIELSLVPLIVVAAIGTVVGILWSIFGPAKKPKGPAPAEPIHPEPPEVSRFDDFEDDSTPTETPRPDEAAETPAEPEAGDAATDGQPDEPR